MRIFPTSTNLHFLAILLLILQVNIANANPDAWVGNSFWGARCFGKEASFGPFDYMLKIKYAKELHLVESAHFTYAVENLSRGKTSSDVMDDLDYTLRAWPNHHRALNSVIKLRLRYGDNFPRSRYIPAECYLQRALRFSPKDPTTHMLYGMLLHRFGKYEEALKLYGRAEELSPNDLQIKYNMGLLLCEMGREEEAENYSDQVYTSKFPLPGLNRKLLAGECK